MYVLKNPVILSNGFLLIATEKSKCFDSNKRRRNWLQILKLFVSHLRHRKRSGNGRMVRSPNQKQSTTAPSNLSATVFSARAFLVRSLIGSASAENTNA